MKEEKQYFNFEPFKLLIDVAETYPYPYSSGKKKHQFGFNVLIFGGVSVGENVTIGSNCIISYNATIENGVTIGDNCVIGENCIVGKGTEIKSFVELRKDTVIGEECKIDSYVKSSGQNKIGNNVTLRFNVTIAREVTVKDGAFLAPNVMTEYSDHQHRPKGGTVIGEKAFIGTGAVISQGVQIEAETVVGALSYVKDNLTRGIYTGTPAKLKRLLPDKK